VGLTLPAAHPSRARRPGGTHLASGTPPGETPGGTHLASGTPPGETPGWGSLGQPLFQRLQLGVELSWETLELAEVLLVMG
jgi:hypothetical protein